MQSAGWEETREESVFAPAATQEEAQEIFSYFLFRDQNGKDLVALFNSLDPIAGSRVRFVREHMDEIRAAMKKSEVPGVDEMNGEAVKQFFLKAIRYDPNKTKTVTDTSKRDAFVEQNAEKEGYSAWIDGLLENLIEKKGIFNGKDMFYPSGKRRSWEQRHYEYNLENIVRAMYSTQEAQGAGFFGNNLFGSSAQKYDSVDAIRSDKERLRTIDDEAYENLKSEYVQKLGNIADTFARDRNDWQNRESASDLLLEAVMKRRTRDGIAAYLKNEGAGWTRYSDAVVDSLISLVEDVRKMPTGYFEAKPARPVYADEIKGVVLPESSDIKLLDALDARGISYLTYENKNDADRINKVNRLADEKQVKFSQRNDTEYMTAVQNGDRSFADSTTGERVRFSIREGDPPKKTIKGYKVFFVKDGKLYPPMVANPNGADTPVGVWLNADVGVQAPDSKTGRKQVKAGGKGTQGGSGSLAFRPGWHLGEIPLATQFDRMNPETGKKELFPENFVWAECEIAADVDYQEEAMSYGYTKNGKFQHSLAGLPRLPVDGYYKYRTNPNPDTVPWLITGAMKVTRLLSDADVNEILAEHAIAPKMRVGGKKTLADLGLDFDKKSTTSFNLKDKSDYTEKKQADIQSYLDSVDDKLVAHYKKALQETNKKRLEWMNYEFGNLPSAILEKAKELVGFDISDFISVINGESAKHINVRHGPSGKQDQTMRMVDDVGRMNYVYTHADDVKYTINSSGEMEVDYQYRNKDNTPSKVLTISKQIDGAYYVVIAVPESKAKRIAVKSAYLTTKIDGNQELNADAFIATPEANLDLSSDNSLAQNPIESQVKSSLRDQSVCVK